MFRPWPNQAQPDRSWATFNNAAGNRININNFGLHPRGHAAPAFMNPEPRLFNFSQLFNITTNNNFGPVPLRPNQPGRLRNRVTVVLPDGSRVLLERDLLHEHLPRTRNFMQRGLFPVPEFLRGYDDGFMGTLMDPRYFEHAFARGTTFVFRHLEGLCQSYTSPYGGAGAAGGVGGGGGNGAFDLFARPRYLLANARDRGVTVREIFWHVFILCCVLDQDRAFGCSDLLARPIAEFLVDFLPSVEAFLPPLAMQILFVGYARIFRESIFELEVLKQMWESMDVMDQTHIRGMMGPQLATNGMGNNAQRVWTALRHLGLV